MNDDIEPSYYWNDVKRALNEFLMERFRDCGRAGFNRRQPEVDALKARVAVLEARCKNNDSFLAQRVMEAETARSRVADLEARVAAGVEVSEGLCSDNDRLKARVAELEAAVSDYSRIANAALTAPVPGSEGD